MRVNNITRWMKEINNDRRLDSILMPGSHDSGMDQSTGSILQSFARTQDRSYFMQMICGCRYFDTRIDFSGGGFSSYHAIWHGSSLADIVSQAVKFLRQCPTETIFLKLSKPKVNSQLVVTFIYQKLDELHARDLLLTNAGNIASKTILELRGRLILLADSTFFIAALKKNPREFRGAEVPEQVPRLFAFKRNTAKLGKAKPGKEPKMDKVKEVKDFAFELTGDSGQRGGIHLFTSNPGPDQNLGMCVYGKYSNDWRLGEVITKQNDSRLEYVNKFGGQPNKGHLYAYYWTQTGSAKSLIKGAGLSIKGFSKSEDGATSKIDSLGDVFELWGNKPNLVMHDFVSEKTCTEIVALNA